MATHAHGQHDCEPHTPPAIYTGLFNSQIKRVTNQRDGPAVLRLGRDVANAEAVRAAREAAVRQQRAVLRQPPLLFIFQALQLQQSYLRVNIEKNAGLHVSM